MCVIIMVPKGANITQEIMETAIERNPHGWGMSVRLEDGTFKVAKGWSEREAWRKWQKLGNEGERIFHARVATHGGVSLQNLHPFDASVGDEGRLFYHNGTVNSIPQFVEDRSDSWHVATMLKSFPTSKRLIDELAALARKEQSRFVLCLPKQTWYLGTGWIEREGIKYSNGSALGGVQHKRRAWAGGLLHAEGTVSDTACEGFKYDPETKMYTPDPNYKPPTVEWDEKAEAEKAKTQAEAWRNRKDYSGGGGYYDPEGWGTYDRDAGPYRRHGVTIYTGQDKEYDKATTLFGPGKYPCNPIKTQAEVEAMAKASREKGDAPKYRFADDEGIWWETWIEKGHVFRKNVRGPFPGTTVYRQPNRIGLGVILAPNSDQIIGRYDYMKLDEEVIRAHNLVPFHQRTYGDGQTDATKGEKSTTALATSAEKSRAEADVEGVTAETWAVISQADQIPNFFGWTWKEILQHYRNNGNSLEPFPVDDDYAVT